jgi:hypothetical protein
MLQAGMLGRWLQPVDAGATVTSMVAAVLPCHLDACRSELLDHPGVRPEMGLSAPPSSVEMPSANA